MGWSPNETHDIIVMSSNSERKCSEKSPFLYHFAREMHKNLIFLRHFISYCQYFCIFAPILIVGPWKNIYFLSNGMDLSFRVKTKGYGRRSNHSIVLLGYIGPIVFRTILKYDNNNTRMTEATNLTRDRRGHE